MAHTNSGRAIPKWYAPPIGFRYYFGVGPLNQKDKLELLLFERETFQIYNLGMDCIFCKIASGEIPSPKVYEDDLLFVIRDINPKAPIHDLIIPREHIKSLNELENKELAADLLLSIKKVAEIEGISEKGYRVIINTGKQGGQLVEHLHFHLLGGKSFGPKIVF